MIVSFADKMTEDLFHGRTLAKTRKFPANMQKAAIIKLDILNAVNSILDLKSPPGNRLESLEGNLKGKYSIQINDQWLLVFRFEDSNAYDVQIMDYH
ncbi:MAG: type II toxin-antitoxin system RelE/ParE family toxin [Coriobacteriia bacterium]|nr:type II toxin-antitoxin system RelE/ParE family toxin [Coriobacteriia bacterium]MCL2750801.1 type II toxin-antitoxin system RelE/ParE family toxin [Coriobacteriia bacterium]